MQKIYKLNPTLHNNIWGGNKLREYGKESTEDRIGESWELSFVKGDAATTEGGVTTLEAFPKSTWGRKCEGFDNFPVLTKFIDAKENLSVQVHPDDSYALKYEGQYGKSEMWYVVSADPGAGLYMGLQRECTPEEFSAKVADGTVEELLSFKEVKAGDVFFIEAGTIHAIGGGVLIYEIQQNSTLTYRLYDYMRRDKEGNLRELHVDKAMKVSSLKPYYEKKFSGESVIGSCEYFTTKEYKLSDETLSLTVGEDSYLAITVIDGEGVISYCSDNKNEGISLTRGESFFIPAGAGEFTVSGNLTLITVEAT